MTDFDKAIVIVVAISTHTLRTEGDSKQYVDMDAVVVFQPTPSARRVTDGGQAASHHPVFQPTPSARRVTILVFPCTRMMRISTHTLRTEGDSDPAVAATYLEISTHTLRTEGDSSLPTRVAILPRFQPTPSARRVTLGRRQAGQDSPISTHTLRTEGDPDRRWQATALPTISTHTLRTEGDVIKTQCLLTNDISTHTLHTEGDNSIPNNKRKIDISTHTLHTEGDLSG